jgi:hypothetical protein
MASTINASTSSGLVNTADTSGVLQLQTANTAAVTIDASQFVGIGTASPPSKLSVKQSANSTTGGLQLIRSDNSNYTAIYMGGNDLYLQNTAAGGQIFYTSNAERMRINSAGRVSIGTTEANNQLNVYDTVATTASSTTFWNATFAGINMRNLSDTVNTTCGILMAGGSSGLSISGIANVTESLSLGALAFYTGGSSVSNTVPERMRITSAGKVCIGVTSPLITGATLSLASGGDNTSLALKGDSGTNCGSIRYTSYTTGANRFQLASNENNWFLFNADGTSYAYVGQSITSWSFGSDRRIKKDIVDLPYGLETILAIQPRKYKLLSNNSNDIGFVAQELKLVVPEAVEGEEIPYSDDDTNMERASKTMGVSKDKLIPILVKAIQELNAKVDAQALEIQALKGAK